MTKKTCIFCRIGRGEIPCVCIVETDQIIVFQDINPKAPTHLLAIPREHLTSLPIDPELAAAMMKTIIEAARICGIAESGYRVVVNQGKDAGQEIDHLHFHIFGGRALAWPPC